MTRNNKYYNSEMWKKLIHDILFVINPCIVGSPHTKYNKKHTMIDVNMGKYEHGDIDFEYPGEHNSLCTISNNGVHLVNVRVNFASTCSSYIRNLSGLGYIKNEQKPKQFGYIIDRLFGTCGIFICPTPGIYIQRVKYIRINYVNNIII